MGLETATLCEEEHGGRLFTDFLFPPLSTRVNGKSPCRFITCHQYTEPFAVLASCGPQRDPSIGIDFLSQGYIK